MTIIVGLVLALLAIWLAAAFMVMAQHGIPFRQAFLYAPIKVIWRVNDTAMKKAVKADAPVIYIITHRSRIDPAIMLSLLPEDTLHMLDPYTAEADWLSPYRGLARTIAFNSDHVFVSRRLTRHLRGKGRLAVYIPDMVEPDQIEFRLYRAIARIATKSDAAIVPIFIRGAQMMPFSRRPKGEAPRRLFPDLSINALEPKTIAQLREATGPAFITAANALFDRCAEVRIKAYAQPKTIFQAVRNAALRYGPSRHAIEDTVTGEMSYRALLIAANVLARRFISIDQPGETVGLLMPSANASLAAFLGLQSAGRVTAFLNYSTGPGALISSLKTAQIRTMVSSRAFIEKGQLQPLVEAVEATGTRIVWLEDLRKEISGLDKVVGALTWRNALWTQVPEKPAVVVFSSGSEGTPKGIVLSHNNILSNVWQAEARLRFSLNDKLLTVLPLFHSFGLTVGALLPLVAGVRSFLYPSPLHYKQIPEAARKSRPTILLGTDTFFAGYARTAEPDDFSSLRMAVAGAEPVRAETRRLWREKFGLALQEGYGMTEASPVVAVNTVTHSREGSVGRLFPGMTPRLETVDGMTEGGRLHLRGPNLMMGVMTEDAPGQIKTLPPGDFHDTGDIVAIDREGYIFIKGRAKRFAKIGGEMISLASVENLANDLWPDFDQVATTIMDPKRGERIVLLSTKPDATVDAIRLHAEEKGSSRLVLPDRVFIVSEVPRLSTGKINYVTVEDMVDQLMKKSA
ncbi:AMP-binding protein [Limoniibacter endophyticus]|uniref:2-acyl-glycerophospho-ethanolamine acyltransferase n=1 Tax=Limoniibacter endophyticus TaxID=1565040 RepID=A0A8J3DLV1_9HYPH|nr:AMP-binding protein [Limoniibacter endophyticus]GHC68887.1 2-acyl-glycerophospho-ethanolamine acyltransferase [Limoniibacter endophyticus]